MSKKEFTPKDVATIIYEAILESPHISPDLITTITAVVKSFTIANNVVVYEKNAESRKHAANIANITAIFYRKELSKLVDDMEPFYVECDKLKKEYIDQNTPSLK